MKNAKQLLNLAQSASAEDEALIPLTIYGLCETAAERGDYLCRFDRTEYLIEHFDHMRKLGCAVDWDCGTIYVRWA